MTNVIINSQEIIQNKNNINTLKDLVNFATQTKDEGVVVNINLNGTNFSEDELEHQLSKNISKFRTVELTVLSRFELAVDSINTTSQYLKLIDHKINLIISSFRNNNLKVANNHISELTEMLQLFLTLTSKIFITCTKATGPDLDNIAYSYNYQKLELIKCLSSIIAAHQQNDITLICDLLEYDLKDNLELWQQETLTKMNILLNSFL